MLRDEHPGIETIRAVRIALATIRRDFDAMLATVTAIPSQTVMDYACKGSVGRARARQRIIQAMRRKPFIETDRAMLWRVLLPRRDPLGTEHPRYGVEVVGVFLGLSRRPADI